MSISPCAARRGSGNAQAGTASSAAFAVAGVFAASGAAVMGQMRRWGADRAVDCMYCGRLLGSVWVLSAG
eukprot:6464354-Prymnesium_polylepis.1